MIDHRVLVGGGGVGEEKGRCREVLQSSSWWWSAGICSLKMSLSTSISHTEPASSTEKYLHTCTTTHTPHIPHPHCILNTMIK